MNKQHVGSSFDDLLAESGCLEEVTSKALERAGDLQKHQNDLMTACVDASTQSLILQLASGVSVHIPLHLCEGLADAPVEALKRIDISPSRTGLHFVDVDADLYVPALLNGVFGTKAWMAKLGAAPLAQGETDISAD